MQICYVYINTPVYLLVLLGEIISLGIFLGRLRNQGDMVLASRLYFVSLYLVEHHAGERAYKYYAASTF